MGTIEMSKNRGGGGGGRGRSPPRGGYRGRSRSPPRGGRSGRERPERTKFALILKNLSSRATWMDLKDMGRRWGHVTFADANKHTDREGVISYSNKNDLKNAYENIQGQDLHGRPIEAVYEFPEVLDESWKGDINNDHPSYNPRDRRESRSPPRGRSPSPKKNGDRFSRSRSRSRGRFSRSRSR